MCKFPLGPNYIWRTRIRDWMGLGIVFSSYEWSDRRDYSVGSRPKSLPVQVPHKKYYFDLFALS